MTSDSDNLVPVFMPALIVLLMNAEDKKGSPLNKDQVLAIRDAGTCIMMNAADAQEMDDSRAYQDIDPENCWYDWQMARREMGRKPDLDPGVRFSQVQSDDPAFRQTIIDARNSIELFRSMLNTDGSPRPDALIKIRIVDGENSAFMWLNNTAAQGMNFTAELFEVPDTLPSYKEGDRFSLTTEELMDWMVNDDGRLSGGYSLRYARTQMSDSEKRDFDRYVGVSDYI
jgi:uncharacterized protein YegJ (DUF2314 family)